MKNTFLLLIIAIISLSCDKEKKWTKLLNDNDLNGWHYYNDNGNKFGWSVSDGILSFDPTVGKFQLDSQGNILTHGNGNPKKENNDLVSDLDFKSFKLYFEWKVDSLTNSGFMWGVKEGEKYEFPFVTGPEIQIMDNNYPAVSYTHLTLPTILRV